MITQTYDLNLIPEYNSVPVIIHISQYDSGRTLVFNLLDGDVAFMAEDGTTAVIEGTKPDGHGFSYGADLDGQTVTAQVTRQMAAAAGSVRCELRLEDSTGNIGTANFVLEVERAGLADDTDVSDTPLPVIIAMATEQMEAAKASAESAAGSASDAADSAESARENKDAVQELTDRSENAVKVLLENEQAIVDAADNAHAAAKSAQDAEGSLAEIKEVIGSLNTALRMWVDISTMELMWEIAS